MACLAFFSVWVRQLKKVTSTEFFQNSHVKLLDGWCLQHHHLYKSQVKDLKNTLLDLQVKMDDPPASGANAVPNVTWLKGSGWRGVGGVPDLHFLVFGIFHSHFLVRRSSKSEEWQVLSWLEGWHVWHFLVFGLDNWKKSHRLNFFKIHM